MPRSPVERMRRRIAENLQRSGFHYHGDFRDIVAILETKTDVELSVLDNFVEEVLTAEREQLVDAIGGKGNG